MTCGCGRRSTDDRCCTHSHRRQFTMRQNIQNDQTLMVPAIQLFCEDMLPRLKQTHMRDYWPHTLLWASQLQVAECCPTEVDAGPVANLKSLSIEAICIKPY